MSLPAVRTEEDRLVWQALAGGLRPPERVTLSDWAASNFRLSSESSSISGRFRPYPFQKAWLDALTDPEVERVTILKSARVGYTTFLKAGAAYFMAEEPCPIMMVQPTIQDAEGFSQEEIAPMIRDVPVLSGLVADSRARDSGNTILRKYFPGGYLVLVGANSPRGFRRRNIRVLMFDEVDGYPASAGPEGDPLKLGEKRTMDFRNRKICYGSTPGVKQSSRIERRFLASNMQRLYVPCPDCGHQQTLKWGGFRYDKGDPDSVVYVCENCAVCIPPRKKRWMVERGEWIADDPTNKKHQGFHIWQAYSYNPLADWPNLVREWEDAQGDQEALKAFVNTVLGETWDLRKGNETSHQALYSRREGYVPSDMLPEGVLVITMATDVQDNRLETEIAGWGVGEEKWVLDYVVTMGDPSQSEVWEAHDTLLETRWQHPSGVELGVAAAGIDSGGHHTDSVYRYVRPRQSRRVYAIKGSSQAGHPIIGRSKGKNKGSVALYFVGTDAAKDLISGRLKMEEAGPGYMHFPAHLDEEYFQQLTAEVPLETYKKGVPVRVWTVVPKGARNEAFDCSVYGLAILRQLNVNWTRLEETLRLRAEEIQDEYTGEEEDPAAKKKSKKAVVRRKGKVKKAKYNPRKW